MIALDIGSRAAGSLEPIVVVFGYLGPDSLLPLASVLAAAVGAILLFWNRLVGLARKLFRRRQGANGAGEPGAEGQPAGTDAEDEREV